MDSSKLTIVIFCESYEIAIEAYKFWLSYLSLMEAGTIEKHCEANLSVETNGIFRYVFCDDRFEFIFSTFADAMMSLDEFLMFEGLSFNS